MRYHHHNGPAPRHPAGESRTPHDVRPVIASPRRINPQISPINPSSTVHETPSVPQKTAIMVKMPLTVWRFAPNRRTSVDFLFGGLFRLKLPSASFKWLGGPRGAPARNGQTNKKIGKTEHAEPISGPSNHNGGTEFDPDATSGLACGGLPVTTTANKHGGTE